MRLLSSSTRTAILRKVRRRVSKVHLEKAGIRNKTKVMIGGASIPQQFADEIGADGFSDNASTAVALARKLV